jgi:hypothetical protein
MKIKLALVIAAGTMLAASAASAVNLQWSSHTCFTMDSSFYICKPDDKWNTQETNETLRPVKFIYGKMGANPIIWVQLDNLASGSSSASDYASTVRSRYESRGLKDITVTKEVVSGKDVYIVSGTDNAKNSRFSAALFWRSGVSKVLQIEFTAAGEDFSTYQPQFMTTVSSVRDVR